jgi:vanillate O-demethylase ferredoxin subunit
LHRWIGLGVGALLLVQGLTGAAMVFRDELNHTVHHSALTVVPAGPTVRVQKLLDDVRALHPTLNVLRIEYPKRADEAFWFRMEAPGGGAIRYVSVDPYRGTITRDAPLIQWPAHWLFELHQELLLGPAGENIVGVEAVALLALAILGPLLWWPGRRRLQSGFSVTFGAGGYRGTRDLHRVGGVLVALVLITTACTGILVVWRTEVQDVAAKVMPMAIRPAPKVAKRAGVPLRPVDEFVASAHAKYGESMVKSVRFPGGHGRVIAVYLQAAGTVRPRATDQIWFDGYSGAQIGSYEAATLPAGTTFLDWMLPVHTGQALGFGGRLLFFVGGLGLAGLGVTGFVQWLLRRRLERHSELAARLPRKSVSFGSSAGGLADASARSADETATGAIDVTVARAWEEARRIRAVELRAADGRELPAFTAGAHIDVHLPNGLVRQYSIWSDPADRMRYCIAVLREEGSRGGSIAIHALRVGATLRIGAPRNTFPLHDSPATTLLIAGGIGVTPILAMAAQLARLGKPFNVHYCARRRAEAAFVTRLNDAVATAGSMTLHLGDEPEPGRFDARLALSAAPEGAHVYVCGPPRLIDAVEKSARAFRWSPSRVHSELFQSAQPPVDSRPFELQLQRSGRTLRVPADRTALEVLEENGVAVPSSCRQGLCGTCATSILSGTPEHHDRVLTPAERERANLFTPCCSRARTPVLVLDL